MTSSMTESANYQRALTTSKILCVLSTVLIVLAPVVSISLGIDSSKPPGSYHLATLDGYRNGCISGFSLFFVLALVALLTGLTGLRFYLVGQRLALASNGHLAYPPSWPLVLCLLAVVFSSLPFALVVIGWLAFR